MDQRNGELELGRVSVPTHQLYVLSFSKSFIIQKLEVVLWQFQLLMFVDKLILTFLVAKDFIKAFVISLNIVKKASYSNVNSHP